MPSSQLTNEDQLNKLRMEGEVLNKIIYKSYSQHRNARHFQKLKKVLKVIKSLSSSGLNELLRPEICVDSSPALLVKFESSLLSKTSSKVDQLKNLLGLLILLKEGIFETEGASLEFSKILARSFFMPLSLTVLSCMARIRFLFVKLLHAIVQSYNKSTSALQLQLSNQHEDLDSILHVPQSINILEENGKLQLLFIGNLSSESSTLAATSSPTAERVEQATLGVTCEKEKECEETKCSLEEREPIVTNSVIEKEGGSEVVGDKVSTGSKQKSKKRKMPVNEVNLFKMLTGSFDYFHCLN